MRAENIDYTAREKPATDQAMRVRQAEARKARGQLPARACANEALALARNNHEAAQDYDVIYRAETLWRARVEGWRREAAVAHMRPAGAVPLSDPGRYASRFALVSQRLAESAPGRRAASVAEYSRRRQNVY
jgi:hypothetical protein